MSTQRGGPIFWIHENHVCPDCNRETFQNTACCQNVPTGQFCNADRAGPEEEDTGINKGCERFRFISGADEVALNAEMGLYRSQSVAPRHLDKFTVFHCCREFEVTEGVIHGCPGLEIFNISMSAPEGKTVSSQGSVKQT